MVSSGLGLADEDLLEPALERGVLLDVLAVLVERGRADQAQRAAGQQRLEHVRGVHRPLGRPRADDGVQLVDERDDLPLGGLDLGEDGLEPLLELAAVLGPGDHRAEVEGDEALVAQGLGDVAGDDALGQALDDGGLADAGLADEDGVVLGAAAEHLDDAADLGVAADDRVEPALARVGGEVAAVVSASASKVPSGSGEVTFALPRTVGQRGEQRRRGWRRRRRSASPAGPASAASASSRCSVETKSSSEGAGLVAGGTDSTVCVPRPTRGSATEVPEALGQGLDERVDPRPQLGRLGADGLEEAGHDPGRRGEQGLQQVRGLDVRVAAGGGAADGGGQRLLAAGGELEVHGRPSSEMLSRTGSSMRVEPVQVNLARPRPSAPTLDWPPTSPTQPPGDHAEDTDEGSCPGPG